MLPLWFAIIGPRYFSLISWFKLFCLISLWHSNTADCNVFVVPKSNVGFSSIFKKWSLSTKLSLNEHLLAATITVDVGFKLTNIYLSIWGIVDAPF